MREVAFSTDLIRDDPVSPIIDDKWAAAGAARHLAKEPPSRGHYARPSVLVHPPRPIGRFPAMLMPFPCPSWKKPPATTQIDHFLEPGLAEPAGNLLERMPGKDSAARTSRACRRRGLRHPDASTRRSSRGATPLRIAVRPGDGSRINGASARQSEPSFGTEARAPAVANASRSPADRS